MKNTYTFEPVSYDGGIIFFFIISVINLTNTITFWTVIEPTADNLYFVAGIRLFLVSMTIFTIFKMVKCKFEKKTFENSPVESALLWNHGDFDKFVSYRTPDGIVTFPRKMGFAYPETAMLYRNPKD